MDQDSLEYLRGKNNKYHDWIDGEIQRFNDELNTLNDTNYAEAIKALEEKYQQNTQ